LDTANKNYRLKDFDYRLPPELIAKFPAKPRDSSRLMVLFPDEETIAHDTFLHMDRYLPEHSLLVVNDTKVMPSRMLVTRERDGKPCDFLLLSPLKDRPGTWKALVKNLGRIKEGETFLTRSGKHSFRFLGRAEDEALVEFAGPDDILRIIEEEGEPPLPPYIDRPIDRDDAGRYQTIYARHSGSSAAPTAGLHFTDRVFSSLEKKGVTKASVTLHVGRGTFSPVREEVLIKHRMHEERFSVSEKTAGLLNGCKKSSRTITAAGTTTLRTLESIYDERNKTYSSGEGQTSIFIYPPQEVRSCQNLLTNFHLPASTLLMLVCAFGGYDFMMHAYAEAVSLRYRFFSYGDAMLIVRK
jgi:S-adenosylmethionine:tRNA ribosyltransferase-isomerase